MEETWEEEVGKNKFEKDWFFILNINVEEAGFWSCSLNPLIHNTSMTQNKIIRH